MVSPNTAASSSSSSPQKEVAHTPNGFHPQTILHIFSVRHIINFTSGHMVGVQ